MIELDSIFESFFFFFLISKYRVTEIFVKVGENIRKIQFLRL